MAENPNPASPDINPWLIAIAVMSSTFMEVQDTTVVNVSLPPYNDSFLMMAVVFVAMFPFLLLLRKPKRKGRVMVH